MKPTIILFKNDLNDEKIKFSLLTVLTTVLCIMAIVGTFYMEEIMSLLGMEDFPSLFEPSATYAFLDFFGDQVTFSLIIMTLGSMGVLASEIESGSISYSITRPISRKVYTISRIIARALALIVPFILSSIIGWIYLTLMFEEIPFEVLIGAILPLVILFLYMGFLTSLFSSRFSSLNAGLITIFILILQYTLAFLEPLEFLSPFALSNFWVDTLSSGKLEFSIEILGKYLGLCLWTGVTFFATIFSMDRRDL